MRITVNGEERSLDDDATLARVVESYGGISSAGRGVAVAVNGEVVPRSRWSETSLQAEDRVEILRAVGGG